MRPIVLPWKCRQTDTNVFQITTEVKQNSDWESWFLLTSDQHWDNPKSDHALQIEHLELAKKRKAGVLSAGDFFCLMQGKFDKRANKSAVRPEHQCDNYLDSVINTSVDFFSPYAHLFTVIATGNHEQAISDRYETNMIDRFVGALNYKNKSQAFSGGFSGFLVFTFKRGGSSSDSTRIVLHYDHGYGGGGPVTKDMIQHQRRAVYLPDADIVLSGHTHDSWVMETARKRVGRDCKITEDLQTHIKIPSYKRDYNKGHSWAAQKGHPPKPIGAYWLRFFFSRKHKRVLYEIIRAQ